MPGHPQNHSDSIWPGKEPGISEAQFKKVASSVKKNLADDPALISNPGIIEQVYLPLSAWIESKKAYKEGMLIVGVNGGQGTGKSTLSRFLECIFSSGFDRQALTLSIDDLYLTRSERRQLARDVHPLLKTRGVPGTHNVDLGLNIMDRLAKLKKGEKCAIPRFDKSMDDRYPEQKWPTVSGPVDILLFEGWCVAARPQNEGDLTNPINDLERTEDASGIWRHYVNVTLRTTYTPLFDRIDVLIMLKAPGLEKIIEWRIKQEKMLAKLKSASKEDTNSEDRIMSEKKVRWFIQHYERLSRYMMDEMAQRADVILHLNDNHGVDRIEIH